MDTLWEVSPWSKKMLEFLIECYSIQNWNITRKLDNFYFLLLVINDCSVFAS